MQNKSSKQNPTTHTTKSTLDTLTFEFEHLIMPKVVFFTSQSFSHFHLCVWCCFVLFCYFFFFFFYCHRVKLLQRLPNSCTFVSLTCLYLCKYNMYGMSVRVRLFIVVTCKCTNITMYRTHFASYVFAISYLYLYLTLEHKSCVIVASTSEHTYVYTNIYMNPTHMSIWRELHLAIQTFPSRYSYSWSSFFRSFIYGRWNSIKSIRRLLASIEVAVVGFINFAWLH